MRRLTPFAAALLIVFVAPAASASAMDAIVDPARPSVDSVQSPDRTVLAERGPGFDTVSREADSSIEHSAPGDLASEAREDPGDENAVVDALKKCLGVALTQAASAAQSGEGIGEQFTNGATSCLQEVLVNMSPTAEAIQHAVSYLREDVGGAVAGAEPESGGATPVSNESQPLPAADLTAGMSGGGSSLPWWLLVPVALVVIGGLTAAVKSAG